MATNPGSTPPPASPLSADGRPDFLVRLGVMLPCSPQDVKEAYFAKAKVMHPDVGGDQNKFVELQTDYERAVEYCKFHSGRSRWLAESVERYVEQQAISAEIERRGGRVSLEHLDWLKKEIGEDFAQVLDVITGVRLSGAAIRDEDVAYLVSQRQLITSLNWLDLSRTQLSSDAFLNLSVFRNLRKLDVRGSTFGNASLGLLKALNNLEWLGLSGAKVNWFGRLRLRRMRPDVEMA